MPSTSRKTIIAGNWKMHKSRAEAHALAQAIAHGVKNERALPEIVLCPPFTSLAEVKASVAGTSIAVGAQNMEHHESGAYTGEISPGMLKDVGATYIIIGHSERRQYYGETDASVNLKLKTALQHKLIPIVCVGEALEQREAGSTDQIVSAQINGALANLRAEELSPLVVAYEPIWAIGTGKTCESQEANRVCGVIRAAIHKLYHGSNFAHTVPILYGGSVKASSADEQMQQPEIDGALVGGASLVADDFLPIIRAGAKRVQLTTA
jgi:triosephosphate isomerase